MSVVPVIKNEADHAEALAQLEELILADREEDTPVVDALALLIEDYEKKAFPITPVSPADAVRFRMNQLGITQAGLARATHIGRGHISEILQGKRGMSMAAMRAFHYELRIPLTVLFGIKPVKDDDRKAHAG